MKRAFPQKVKPVPSYVTENDVVDQPRQANADVSRLTRTSAAVIGLAISMGAHSLLAVHQSDDAIAAEPTGESSVATTPSIPDGAATTPASEATLSEQSNLESRSRLVGHIVQEGQSLWQLAQLYGVDAKLVAAINGIAPNDVLHVGQVLRIPLNLATPVATPTATTASMPEYYGLLPGASGAGQLNADRDEVLQANQNTSLERLKQKREVLRVGLAKLKTSNQEVSVSEPAVNSNAQAEAELEMDPTTHRVTAGDTLSEIAKDHGISLRDLAIANNITNPNFIRINQVLTIPGAANTQASSAVLPSSVKADQLVAMFPTPAGSTLPSVASDAAPTGAVLSPGVVPGVAPVRHVAQISIDGQVNQLPQSQFQAKLASPEQAVGGRMVEVAATQSDQQDVEVAVAPLASAPAAGSEANASQPGFNYVENLRLEIVKLREKYRTSNVASVAPMTETKVAAVAPVAAPASAAIPAQPERVNPQFNPSGYTESLRSQVRRLQMRAKAGQLDKSSNGLESVSTQSKPQVVAVAPLGSENYEPLVPSSLGQMVSPDLPPLGAVENYLPGHSGKFNGYIWPTKGLLTSGYGWRWGRMHKGIDIAAPIGTPIMAAAPGVVITAGWNSGGYGNLVEIQHPDGSVTLYAHNERILVRRGQQVEQGQQIALMGSTGYSTGPHCHFEVHLPGQGAVNPMAHLSRSGGPS